MVNDIELSRADTGLAQQPVWESKLDLIKQTVAKGTTDQELEMFLYQAKRTGLDPLARQIHCIVRFANGKRNLSIQTGIDGYRLIADRTGLYAGSDDYRFDEGLSEFEHIQTGRGDPVTATVTVHKIVQGQRVPFTASCRWSEYYPGEKGGFMWKKMPYLMLGKTAEALALRKAFPAELSGIYTDAEMAQAGGGQGGAGQMEEDVIDVEHHEGPEEQPVFKPATPSGLVLPATSPASDAPWQRRRNDEDAVLWGDDQGVFNHPNHAQNSFNNLRTDYLAGTPKDKRSKREMYRLWFEKVLSRPETPTSRALASAKHVSGGPINEDESLGYENLN